MELRKLSAVLLTASKTSFGMHADVYEPVSFKLSLMMNSIEHYLLILV